MMSRGLIVFACAALVGGVLGWSSGGRPAEGGETFREEGGLREAPRARWGKEDFVKAVRERAAQPGFNPLARELADWTDEELLAALEASLAHPDCQVPEDPGARLPEWLLAEWMRRDFPAALAWFEALETGKSKERMTSALAIYWPRERGEEGFEYLLANREMFSRSSVLLVMNALQGRLNGGAAATVDFMRRLREEGLKYPGAVIGGTFPGGVQYPPGFDFRALMGSEEFARLKEPEYGVGPANSILSEWHAQDRDAVFDWLVENRGVEGLVPITETYRVDSKENLAWMGGKVESMDDAGREAFVAGVMEKWVWSPERLRHFAAGVSDPALLEEVHRIGVQSLFGGVTNQKFPLLEDLEPVRRIELLEQAEPGESFSGSDRYRRSFTETDEALLRRKLGEWQASEAQIERIVSRFKP